MKIYLPIHRIDECLIEDESEDELYKPKFENKKQETNSNKVKYKDHEIYGKYFKMKRLGIPVQSVQQKMRLENIEISIILKDENDEVREKNTKFIECVLGDLKNVKLNKVSDILIKNIRKYDYENSNNIILKPPTLSEILTIKRNLKKPGNTTHSVVK